MMATAPKLEPKGRPPLRKCPDDFDVIFIEVGRLGCETWYRARRSTINRWLTERGKERLIKLRSEYVRHQRAQGNWLTRSSCMVEHRATGAVPRSSAIRDRREVSITLARHAAQHLRVIRNGGFIVSPTPQGDWWVGSRRMSAGQMVKLACAKGFDRSALREEPVFDTRGDYRSRKNRIVEHDLAVRMTLQSSDGAGVES